MIYKNYYPVNYIFKTLNDVLNTIDFFKIQILFHSVLFNFSNSFLKLIKSR